uniref:Uncharacterized protein n=1 Tax=Rhizophagus irregularis (strain DAOM 181602 / DAOM 197198 / MUCL 43194) TaxID=747089 RepID=U9UIT3_RHIID
MSAISGLNEPKLHEINNYLFQFNKLWSGYNVIILNNQPNFGGFADFDKWFVKQDINIIRENERVYN